MKILYATVIMLIIASNSHTDEPEDYIAKDNLTVISSVQMDGNSIRAWYRNNGSFNRHPYTGNSGFEWPAGSNKFARYASGLWIGAVVGDDTLIAIAEYDYEYLPGYINSLGEPQGKDDSLYRIYKINRNDISSYDYLHWPVYQGAHADSAGRPYIMGDQTMFFSFTDGYPEAHGNNAGSTAPLKAQILQTNWCFNNNSHALYNIILTEYRIINRGNLPWTKCYFAHFTDDDLGGATDDSFGCDSNLSLSYTYNHDNLDDTYGNMPPAVGFQILQGAMKDSPGDTAMYSFPTGSSNFIKKPGKKFLKMSSFMPYYKGDPMYGEPSDFRMTYYNLQGMTRLGLYYINPNTNQPTVFPLSGDPFYGTGWNDPSSGDRRFLQNTGPVTVNPGDTQTIVFAQLIATGSDNLSSISVLKNYARTLQVFFESNFSEPLIVKTPVVTHHAAGDGKIYLYLNDSCERITYTNRFTGSTYRFQGYNIYRIRPNNISPSKSDTILIKTYDITDGVKDIRDSVYLEEYQGIVYGVVQKGSDNGITRYIEITKDTVSGGPFVNGTEYKFSVTAYYYDPSGGIWTMPKVLASSVPDNIVRVVPQSIAPEAQTGNSPGDTLLTDQKDLAVMPVVIDPLKLVDAEYESFFGGTNQNPAWSLVRRSGTADDTVFRNVTDFTGAQDTAKTLDGMMLIHKFSRDSGIIVHPDAYGWHSWSTAGYGGWNYEPKDNLWFEGPDTIAITTAKLITNRHFQDRTIGMSFPTLETYANRVSRIKANGRSFTPVAGQNAILSGGPLRKIQIIFGQPSMSYRFVPTDTNLVNSPNAGMVEVPFSVYAVEELDSSRGAPRQLNTGFLDADNDGKWKADTSKLGGYNFTYIFASGYNPSPQQEYMSKNITLGNPLTGFPSTDAMYVWLPRAKRNADGSPKTFNTGDKLTVWPYRITRPDFVPGYPVKYRWQVDGARISGNNVASEEVAAINVFPNPYYGTSELEYDSGGEKFIYFSNIPLKSTVYIYSLDGVMVRRIDRDSNDPNSSLQKWDLKNSAGSYVASGMYIVYVDCGNAGGKTLKLAVFRSK